MQLKNKTKIIESVSLLTISFLFQSSLTYAADDHYSETDLTTAIFKADPAADKYAISLNANITDTTQTINTGRASISISNNIKEAVKFQPIESEQLNIHLPFAEKKLSGKVNREGLLVFDNKNGSATVPVVRKDNSLQIFTVIANASAPTTYTYKFDLPTNAFIRQSDNLVLFYDEEENFLGGLAPAWAKDSNERNVNTYYKIDGNTVTQVIDHSNKYAYPIVADPWLGKNLWQTITVDYPEGQPRVNLNLSSWGWYVWSGAATGTIQGFAAGQAILNTAGLSEAYNWNATVRHGLNKPSQRQQYECHALGALFAGEWNLEKSRPNLVVHWTLNLGTHRCNWNTARATK